MDKELNIDQAQDFYQFNVYIFYRFQFLHRDNMYFHEGVFLGFQFSTLYVIGEGLIYNCF